mgnify:CR=1 FL=1
MPLLWGWSVAQSLGSEPTIQKAGHAPAPYGSLETEIPKRPPL